MTHFDIRQSPRIMDKKLVLLSNGGSIEAIGIRAARQQLTELEAKTNLRPSTTARRDVLREAVAMWDAQ